jgi:hypothetical protein
VGTNLYCGVMPVGYDVKADKATRYQRKINKAVERFTTVQDRPTQERAAWWLMWWQLARDKR